MENCDDLDEENLKMDPKEGIFSEIFLAWDFLTPS
jgi:hypothetical protein